MNPSATLPPPSAADAADLSQLAEAMVAQARSAQDARMLAAHGYVRHDISIVHQQLRCANLAWALDHVGLVTPGTVVGVVGGSFSGLMLAVSLALRSDAIVYLFEQSPRLLDRFLEKANRHLSPVLNSRFLGKRYDPSVSSAQFKSPIFAWDKGPASQVAHQWMEEFRAFERVLPIFTFTNRRVDAGDLRLGTDRVWIHPPAPRIDFAPIGVDLLIDATGFGEESNRHGVVDYSYWEGGHRLIYDHLRPPARVLLSGCGDSGVIEGLHYAAAGFQHGQVEALWHPGVRLEAILDEGVARARLHEIFQRPDADMLGVVPEICWWHQTRSNIVRNAYRPWDHGGLQTQSIYEAINRLMAPELQKRFGKVDLSLLEAEAVEALLDDGVNTAVQTAVRKAVDPIAQALISENLKAFADRLDLPPQMEVLRGMARSGVELLLNGLTPTAYTRELSPFNVWLMRLLLAMPNVNYRPGVIAAVTEDTKVTFEDGAEEIFDRVVTRYGAKGAGLFAAADVAPVARDHLLDQPFYAASTDGRWVFPVRESIAGSRDALATREAPNGGWEIHVEEYTTRLTMGDNYLPEGFGQGPNLEGRLADALRNSRHPTYLTPAEMARVIGRQG